MECQERSRVGLLRAIERWKREAGRSDSGVFDLTWWIPPIKDKKTGELASKEFQRGCLVNMNVFKLSSGLFDNKRGIINKKIPAYVKEDQRDW